MTETWQIKRAWAESGEIDLIPQEEAEQEFEAWLNSVKAQAWDEGAAHSDEWLFGGTGYQNSETALRNPYRSQAMLLPTPLTYDVRDRYVSGAIEYKPSLSARDAADEFDRWMEKLEQQAEENILFLLLTRLGFDMDSAKGGKDFFAPQTMPNLSALDITVGYLERELE